MQALKPDAHEGYVSWERFEAIRAMASGNVPSGRHHGAPKHDALLVGLVRCKRCDRKLTLRYSGAQHHIPRYSCSRAWMDNGGPHWWLRVDDTVEKALLSLVGPDAIPAATATRSRPRDSGIRCATRSAAILKRRTTPSTTPSGNMSQPIPPTGSWRDELEARWNRSLARVADVEGKIAAHDAAAAPPVIDTSTLGLMAPNLEAVWAAPTTDARLKKRFVRTLIHVVVADIDDEASEIVLKSSTGATELTAKCGCRPPDWGSPEAMGTPRRRCA